MSIATRNMFAALLPAALGLAIASSEAAAQAPLSVQVFNAASTSFHVTAVLVAGRTDAVLLDTGFTRADAHRIAEMVRDSRKTLTTIYISQADPDFYFGAGVLLEAFPGARLVATAPTVKKIEATLATKLQVWGPRLGAEAPRTVPIPAPLAGTTIALEGETLEIRGLDDILAHQSYVWIPSIRTIAGGTNVFAGLHVWTADTQSAEERAAWSRKLDAMIALQPSAVIPGHMLPGQALDATQITYTRHYLTRFETELQKAPSAAALIAAMNAAYPQAGLAIALEIGAKVNKGEMKW